MRRPTMRGAAKLTPVIAGAVLLISCFPGVADYSYDLSGGYQLFRSSAHQVRVIPKNAWNDSTPIIPAKVVEIAWDESVILAKQQHLSRRSPNDRKDTYEIPIDRFSYWILDVKSPAAFGPLTEAAFLAKRIELGVAAELKLRDVESYKH